MHDAYEVVPLLKSTVQVEAIAAYGENLLVGSKQGHLLMYSITPQTGDKKHDVQLLRYNKTFSKKPINQLEVVPEYEMLISLSDGIICVHDMKLYNFPIVCTVERTKGAGLFTLDVKKITSLTGETSVMVRMCVAVKRRLQIFYWKKDKFLDFREDLCLPDIPKALTWCEETIVVGFKGEYCLIEVSGKQHDLFPMGKPQEPSITKLSDKTFALGKDCQSIFMNNKGEAIQKLAVKWPEIPQALAFDDPYLVAILSECAEIRTVEPSLRVQSVPLSRGAKFIVRCRQGQLYAASQSEVWSLQAVPLAQQIHKLLEDKQFELALKLTNISEESQEEKSKNVYQIQTLYAHDLFEKRQYSKSMSEFLKLGTDPYKVIQLFPDLVLKPGGSGGSPDSPLMPNAPRVLEQDLEKAFLALIEYLTEIRQKILGKNDLTNTSEPSVKSRKNLIQIIDTTLLKCYLQTNDALVAPLLRLNRCHLGETEQMLKKCQKYRELIILYQTNGMHAYALKLLQEQSTLTDSPLYGTGPTIKYLQQLGASCVDLIIEHATWVLAQNPEDGLRIFTEDLQEVEQLPRPRVLDFLLRVQPTLVIFYLEHVIKVWGETSDILHNALVHQYQARIQQLFAKGKEGEVELQTLRAKLLKFLETSRHYNPQVVIVQFPLDSLFEERAVVLGRMGMHENAISIYMCTLNDVQRAINYCEGVYQQQQEGADIVYVLLMRMLIDPPTDPFQEMAGRPGPSMQPDVERALNILEENASKIQPIGALKVLPDSVPLVRIQKFLHTSLQDMLAERRKAQMLKGLLYAEHLQVQEQRIALQSQSLLLTEFKPCPVCKKKFSNQSAFARYPNGDIVHYSCQDRRN